MVLKGRQGAGDSFPPCLLLLLSRFCIKPAKSETLQEEQPVKGVVLDCFGGRKTDGDSWLTWLFHNLPGTSISKN